MFSIGSSEAKLHFSELIDRASKGQRITITRRGKPVASIVPLIKDPAEAVDDLIAYRDKHNLTLGMPFRQAIEEGRP